MKIHMAAGQRAGEADGRPHRRVICKIQADDGFIAGMDGHLGGNIHLFADGKRDFAAAIALKWIHRAVQQNGCAADDGVLSAGFVAQAQRQGGTVKRHMNFIAQGDILCVAFRPGIGHRHGVAPYADPLGKILHKFLSFVKIRVCREMADAER